MITPEMLILSGIFPDADATDCLWVESGLGWLHHHTNLPLDSLPLEELPAGAKLFLQRYADVMEHSGIASESIEGLSQSFTDTGTQSLLIELAQNLLPEYFRGVRFVPGQEQWRYRCPKGGRC